MPLPPQGFPTCYCRLFPDKMVQCIGALLDFYYLARRSSHDTEALSAMRNALARFHSLRTVFQEHDIRPDGFSLPRQYSLVHYVDSIVLFGSPNGLCSSITESKHIKAVKEPWRRSNRYNALSQMLLTNSRLDKMHTARLAFEKKGMMSGTSTSYTASILAGVRPLPPPPQDDTDDNEAEEEMDNHVPERGARRGPRALTSVDLARRRGV